MAHYLFFKDGVEDYVEANFPDSLVAPWTFSVDSELISTSPFTHDIFTLTVNDNSDWVSIGKDGNDNWKMLSNSKTPGNGTPYYLNERVVLEIHFDGTLLYLRINGEPMYSTTPTSSGFLHNLGRMVIAMRPSDGTDESSLNLYKIEITENGVLTHSWDPSASGGTGLVLPDTVGGVDGVLHDFAQDDSQWVYYDDGTEEHEFSANAALNVVSTSSLHKQSGTSAGVAVTTTSSGTFIPLISLTAAAVQANTLVAGTYVKYGVYNAATGVTASALMTTSKRTELLAQNEVYAIVSGNVNAEDLEQHEFSGSVIVSALVDSDITKGFDVTGDSAVRTFAFEHLLKIVIGGTESHVVVENETGFKKLSGASASSGVSITHDASLLRVMDITGESAVYAYAQGNAFNTDTNVETYVLTVRGIVKAPLEVQGVIKS